MGVLTPIGTVNTTTPQSTTPQTNTAQGTAPNVTLAQTTNPSGTTHQTTSSSTSTSAKTSETNPSSCFPEAAEYLDNWLFLLERFVNISNIDESSKPPPTHSSLLETLTHRNHSTKFYDSEQFMSNIHKVVNSLNSLY